MNEEVFRTEGLKKYFLATKKGVLDTVLRTKIPVVKAVDDVSIAIKKGEVLALVGESGSGKSTLGRLLVSLETPTDGEIMFFGEKITGKVGLRKLRRSVQIVFQNPTDSLNPRMSIRSIVTEPLTTLKVPANEKHDMFRTALSRVGLDMESFAERRAGDLSGGQRQRIALARAIISNPKFIVLDEPTSALDASVQGQVLNLLSRLHDELGFTYLFITHNIAVARFISDRIAVMYAGKIVEQGPTASLLNHPSHPYTQALLKAVPSIESRELVPPQGEVPSLVHLPKGCRFNPRCPMVMERCRTQEPPLLEYEDREVACWLYESHNPMGTLAKKSGVDGTSNLEADILPGSS